MSRLGYTLGTMALSRQHRRWLRLQQGLVPGLLNLVLNGVIAWLLFRAHNVLVLWGEAGVGTDLLVTGFLLPFLICLINSKVIERQVDRGRLPNLESKPRVRGGWHHRPGFVRALTLGALGVLLASGPLMLALAVWQPISMWSFVGVKGVWAGALAAVVSPLVAWWALAAASPEPEGGWT